MTYCIIQDVRSYLGISEETDDALISNLIGRAQKAIEVYTGRKFEASADSTRYFAADLDTWRDMLYLDEDLAQITSVTTDADGDADSLTQNTHYIGLPRNTTPYYALQMLSSSNYSWTYSDDPETGIEIVGRWAYSVTAPDDIVHVCVRLAAYYYRQKDAQVFDTTAVPDAGVIYVPQGIPADVKLMLDPYVKVLL